MEISASERVRQALASSIDLGNKCKYSKLHDPGAKDQLGALAILDDFSTQCFSSLLPLWSVWPEEIETGILATGASFLLVESAWNAGRGKWRYRIASPTQPKPELVRLINLCKKLGIPTVFWNKEDPPHFDEFVKTASLFDRVYTTEGSLIDTYRSRLGHDRVGVLQFAASPRMHNPVRVERYRKGDIAFAGQYFVEKFPERREQMEFLFKSAVDHDFAIFSRVLGGSTKYQFPHRYTKYVVGSLPYSEMVDEYKRHKIFLNVNSVPDSETMCARRIFELSACKTNVVSAPTRAISRVFTNGEISLVSNEAEAAQTYNSLLEDDRLRLQLGQNAWRTVSNLHLYDHRIEQVVNDLGVNVDFDPPSSTKSLAAVCFLENSDLDSRFAEALCDQLKALPSNVRVHLITVGDSEAFERSFPVEHEQIETRHHVNSLSDLRNLTDCDYVGALSSKRSYGAYHLCDLYFYLRYYLQKDCSVTKVGQSISSEDAETFGGIVYSGGWLTFGKNRELPDMLKAETETSKPIIEVKTPVYRSDGFSYGQDVESVLGWGI